MDLLELKRAVDDAVKRGCGELLVVFRDDNTDPDLDTEAAYIDEDADRFVIRGFW